VSGTQLTATIAAADIATAGMVPVTVTNPGTAGRSLRKRRHAGRDFESDDLYHQLGEDRLPRSSSSNGLSAVGKLARIHLLSGAHCHAVLDSLSGNAGDHVLERGKNADRIEVS